MDQNQSSAGEEKLDDSDPVVVAAELRSLPPPDAADTLRSLPADQRGAALLALNPDAAADILEELPDDLAAAAVMTMAPGRAAAIVQEMRSDEEADLLQDVTATHATAILDRVDPENATAVRKLLEHSANTAGGLMQSELIAIEEGLNAGDVVRQLRQHSREYADYPTSYLYVVDQDRVLRGVVSLRALLLCDAGTPIAGIATTDVESAPADLPGVELVKLFRRLHYLAMPVVDANQRLLGVVTQDDAMRFAEEEADEEMLRLAGIAGGDEFRDMPLARRSWRRLTWLSVNILLNVMAASVIAMNQSTLEQVIALAVFLPIISDMSGCSGNQAVAVSIRELSLDRITPGNLLWVLRKEFFMGMINGCVLGSLIGLIAWAWKDNAALGLVVGAALYLNTIVAVSIGGLVPLVLRRLDRDPAIAASPILTTLTDMCGFYVVLALAGQCLPYLPRG